MSTELNLDTQGRGLRRSARRWICHTRGVLYWVSGSILYIVDDEGDYSPMAFPPMAGPEFESGRVARAPTSVWDRHVDTCGGRVLFSRFHFDLRERRSWYSTAILSIVVSPPPPIRPF